MHETVLTAFENGVLERFADSLNGGRSASKRERLVAKIVADAGS